MNTDIAEGKWKQLKGKVHEAWRDLTDDEIDKIQGREEQFVGLLQQKYGITKEEAKREFSKLRA